MSVFTKEMANFLAKRIQEDYDKFYPTNREHAYAAKAKAAWNEVTEELNSGFGSTVSVAQVQEKYKNMKKMAKRKNAEEMKYKRGTGGGPENPTSSHQDERVEDDTYRTLVETHKERATFSGVPGGISTEIFATPKTKCSIVDKEISEILDDTQKYRTTVLGKRRTPTPLTNAGSSLADLQRIVLELQLKNEQKISHFFDNVVPKVECAFEQMTEYYQFKNRKQKMDYLVAEERSPITYKYGDDVTLQDISSSKV